MQSPHGAVHWTELNTREPEKAAAYYAAVLGWEISEMPMPGGEVYRIGMIGEMPTAGIFEMTGPEFEGVPEHWFTYFAVSDINAAVEQVTASGGYVVKQPFEVPGVGKFIVARDVNGAVCGMMQPAEETA